MRLLVAGYWELETCKSPRHLMASHWCTHRHALDGVRATRGYLRMNTGVA